MQHRPIHTELLRPLAVVMLLIIYVGVVLVDGLHVFFEHHHDAQQHCSLELETSPCHQKIYHHNIIRGCDHQTHLVSEDQDCELCDALIADFYNSKKDLEKTDIFSVPVYTPFLYSVKIISFFYPSISLRGPPAFV